MGSEMGLFIFINDTMPTTADTVSMYMIHIKMMTVSCMLNILRKYLVNVIIDIIILNEFNCNMNLIYPMVEKL